MLRRRARVRKAKQSSAARQEWLNNFNDGDRQRFFNHVVVKEAVFLAAFARDTGLPRDEAATVLERVASERRWRKLRTRDGTVIGIAPPRWKKPDPELVSEPVEG